MSTSFESYVHTHNHATHCFRKIYEKFRITFDTMKKAKEKKADAYKTQIGLVKRAEVASHEEVQVWR